MCYLKSGFNGGRRNYDRDGKEAVAKCMITITEERVGKMENRKMIFCIKRLGYHLDRSGNYGKHKHSIF